MPHVSRLRDATLPVHAARASAPRRNVARGRHTCGGSAPQRCPWAPHVRWVRAATLSVVATRAAARVRNVACGRHTCGGSAPQCCLCAPHVRANVQERYTSASPTFLLDIQLNRRIKRSARSKIVKSPALAVVGGTGVLEKHIRPVPARELSHLLVPRAFEVCTRLGKTSTGTFDSGAAERWGQVEAFAQRQRLTLPTVDAQLASMALHHGLTFVTRNAEDVRMTGVSLFNPWTTRP